MKSKIDGKRFWPSIIIITIVLIFVTLNLKGVQSVVDIMYAYMSREFGWIFILSNLCALFFSIWISISPKGKIRLGGDECKPAYSKFSWIAMMFTTSCSAGLIVFGFIETIYYSSAPPFQLEPFSVQAYEYAEMYSHYHWGLNAWSLYVPISVGLGYMLYNKKKNSVAVSISCSPVLKRHNNGFLGCLIDVLGIFGAVVAPVTSMGLGMPLLTLLIQNIFGISDKYISVLQIAILLIWILIFGTSIYLGLEKGIKNLSNINVILAFLFMIFVGGLAGYLRIFRSEINTLGLYISNFVRMVTYTDPYGDGMFVSKWTIWYWAWLIVYMPLMGVFNARISKGRTLREIAIGQMIWCSLGCWVAMATLGNYAIKLQQGGINIAAVLNEGGQPAAILAIINEMPCSNIMMIFVAILCFVFMATTVDSSSYVAAESTSKHLSTDEQAPRWMRVFWAAIACIITFVLLQVGGFNAVQVLAILIGLPLAIVMFLVVASAIKMIKGE